jgi:hypothetical protein
MNSFDCGDFTCTEIETCLAIKDMECPEPPTCELCDFVAQCDSDPIDPPKTFPWLPKPEPTTPPKPPPTKFKAMIVGDSITHGAEGDFTWRYRLWEWLKSENVEADFVGPWTGTHGRVKPEDALPKPPSLSGEEAPAGKPDDSGEYRTYIDPAFPKKHAAMWGRQAAQSKNTIREWVSTHQPDYLLVMLGFNDLGWWVSDAQGTILSMDEFVRNARSAKSDVKFLIADIVHRSFIGGRGDLVVSTTTYNNLIVDAVKKWNTDKSPVKLVKVQTNYDCYVSSCSDGYDGLHPNEKGEFKIAQAFSRTLVEFKIGSSAMKLPAFFPVRTNMTPRNFKVSADPKGILATWDHFFGARSYEIRERLEGLPWGDPFPARSNVHLRSWVLKGQKWEVQVRTVMGDDDKSDWSSTQSATADPRTPTGPQDVISRPTADGLSVGWKQPKSGAVNLYEVLVFDMDTPGAWLQSYATRDMGRSVNGLTAGHRYVVAVLGWNSVGGGWPTTGRAVIPGGGFPSTPGNVKVVNQDPTTVTISWSASSGAAGYRVWLRNWKNNDDLKADEYGTTGDTSHGIAFLFPGTWNYEFCVTAYNGELESAKSNCVRPPVYPGFEGRRVRARGTEVRQNATLPFEMLALQKGLAMLEAASELPLDITA